MWSRMRLLVRFVSRVIFREWWRGESTYVLVLVKDMQSFYCAHCVLAHIG